MLFFIMFVYFQVTHDHMVSTFTLVLVCLIYYGAICIEIGHMLHYVVYNNLDPLSLSIV